MTLTEGSLEIEVPDAVGGGRFDGAGHGLSHCMKAVDFVLELPDRYLFIELKDPQHEQATLQQRNVFVANLHSGELEEDLTSKYRDSFSYEWAMGRADKRTEYRVLIALSTLSPADLLTRTESLQRVIPLHGPSNRPWRRRIVDTCGVFNLTSWNRRFPSHPVRRRT